MTQGIPLRSLRNPAQREELRAAVFTEDEDELPTQVFALSSSNRPPQAALPAQARHRPSPVKIPQQAMRFVYSTVRHMAMQSHLSEAEHLLTRSLHGLCGADRSYCLYYRPDTNIVWSYGRPSQSSEMHPAGSLAAGVASDQSPLLLSHARMDTRYCGQVDDPFGDGSQRIMLVPVSAMGQVVAVLVVARGADKPEFTPLDIALLQTMARESASMLVHFLTQMYEAHHLSQNNSKPGLFRQAALDHRENESALGEVVQNQERWLPWAFRILILSAVTGLILLFVIPVHQYSSGTSVIRMEGLRHRASFAGTVEKSYVVSGERVTKGQLLVAFRSEQEESNSAAIEQRYQQELVALLENPSDEESRRRLRSIVSQREQAKQKIEELQLRAEKDGIVSDLRVQSGQIISLGQPVLSIIDENTLPTLTALLPGNTRPKLRAGMTLRFRLAGYARSEQEATIEWISSEVVGPAEAQRFLGEDMADAVAVRGPVVLVRARLKTPVFKSEGEEFRFHNGMYGDAEVKIGSETILSSILNRK